MASTPFQDIQVFRHKTAIRRNQLSRPVRLALRDGILLPEYSVFDFGCGRGEDVEYLKGMGFRAAGWDPVHFDHAQPSLADVVNLGYVINVIEVPQERKDTLKRAYEFARKVLVVSAQVGYFDDQIARSKEFEDGYITSRNTFQKYFEQEELRDYIRETLGQEPYAAGIGVYYVFRDSDLEGAYCRRLYEDALPTAFTSKTLTLTLSAETLSAIADWVLRLGRLPEPSEAQELGPAIAILSASEGWLRRLSSYLPQERLVEIETRRKREFLGKLLSSYFGSTGKLRMCDFSESERADLRCFFGSYVRATQQAETLYQTLVERFEQLDSGQLQVVEAVDLQGLPDDAYYLWMCLVSALELEMPNLLSYCPVTLRLEWRQATEVGLERWVYQPWQGAIFRGDEESAERQDFSLFSRRQSNDVRTPRVRAVPQEMVDKFVDWMLTRGRFPAPTEFDGPRNHWTACLRNKLWLSSLQGSNREEQYEAARKLCWESILYRVGTSLFQPGGRPTMRKWPEDFQSDIRHIFGSYAQACAESDSWMRRMGDAQYVESEVRGAGRGLAHPEKGLYFDSSILHKQPLVVQLLIETARKIGAADMPVRIDVIRVSYNGDVVKFYQYDDFDTPNASPLRAVCKVMFRKRKVFGRDYPVGYAGKQLEEKETLRG